MAKQEQEQEIREPRTLHPLIAWPTIYALAVFVAAWLYQLNGREAFSPWWLAAVAPVVALAGASRAREVWNPERYGHRQGDDGRALAWAAGLVTAAWLVWAGHVGPPRAWAVWLLLVALLALWWWVLALRAPRQREQQATLTARLADRQEDREWRGILDAAGCGDVLITGKRDHRAGFVLTCEPDPDADRMPTYADFAARSERIAVQAASRARRAGRRMPPDAVRPEPGGDDAEFELHVRTREPFEEPTAYVPDDAPRNIVGKIDIGEMEDAARMLLDVLAGHMKIVGASGSGKTVFANNLIGRITACSNALLWIGATDKLIPLIFPWLRAFYEGSGDRPVLDYVAGKSPRRVLEMLRDAYRLACERNDRLADESKMSATSREPVVFVLVEEVSHAVEFVDTIETHDGQDATISDLLKMLAQAGRSANVRLILLTQYGTNTGLGDRASEMMRNITCRACLRTMEPYDGGRTLPALPGNVDTTKLPTGQLYLQQSTDVPRTAPVQPALFEGSAMISPVAARQAGWRPVGVEAESDLGEDYERRWDQLRHPELAAAVRRAGLEWRVPGVESRQDPPAGGVVGEGAPVVGDEPAGVGEGDSVDTSEGWTDATDAAFRELLGTVDPPPPRPFQLPDLSVGLRRLRRMADEMGRAPRGDDEPDEGPQEEPDDRDEGPQYATARPVPEPLAAVVAWLERLDEAGAVVPEWYLTEALAVGIGWGAERKETLGIQLSGLGLRSGNLPRALDPQRRKGYRVSDLREAATRHRFGL